MSQELPSQFRYDGVIMRAELFFCTNANDAIPILFVNQEKWSTGLPELDIVERNLLFTQQFKAAVGDCCFVADENGKCKKVYLGTGKNFHEKALATAALKLPPGNYLLQEEVTDTAKIYWALAQYRFDSFKKIEFSPRCLVDNSIDDIAITVDAVFTVRNLINSPANYMQPQNLAEFMSVLAAEFGAEFNQWVGDELLRDNFPAIHAVGRASINQPRLLKLTWGNPKDPKVTLVGKGVCFDSGGLDIKPSSGMRLMKKDMGGAANAIGLAQWLMAKRLPIYLTVLVPAVENAIGPDAYRPGDILTMRNGLTVEIDNTDAEGRLILADALAYAVESEPELVVDFSTLTGAARTAVGTEISAMFCNDELLSAAVIAAADEVKDPVWRLPLFSEYEAMIESPVADLVNSAGSPYAGAITAALFLQHFVNVRIPWLHFDLMAWNLANKPGKPEGGEAMAIRSVAQYLRSRYPVKA